MAKTVTIEFTLKSGETVKFAAGYTQALIIMALLRKFDDILEGMTGTRTGSVYAFVANNPS